MNANTRELSDGFLSLLGGMHSGIDPITLSAESGVYAKGINVIAREGVIQTRPAFVPFKQLASGKFQGAMVWKLDSTDRLVYVVDGVLYSMRFDTKAITNHGLLFSTSKDRMNYCQADRWAVIQDGTAKPQALEEYSGNAILYTRPYPYTNGSDSPPKELALVPGSVMSYAHGRIHYVPTILPALAPALTDETDAEQLNLIPDLTTLTGRTSFVSTDIMDVYVPEFIFRMSEHRVLNEGGGIELPMELGSIHGMATMRNAATGTGSGPLVLFAREGLVAFDVSISRTEWKNNQIGQVLFSTIGTISPYSLTQINTDIGFIDTEGRLRTLKYEASNIGNSLTSLPMSHELDEFHKADTNPQLAATSMNFHDSRLTFTLLGGTGPIYKALASLDLAKVYNLAGAGTNPSFDGIWTGFDFQQTLTARDENKRWRHFVVIKKGNENHLFVLDSNAILDNNDKPIESTIITRFMDFGSAVDTKALQYVNIWFSDIKTDSQVELYFRPRGYPFWTPVATSSFVVPGGKPQFRRSVSFPLTIEEIGCDPVSEEKLSIATHIQFAIRWRGRLKIDRFRAVATLRVDPPGSCLEADNPDNVEITIGLELDDLAYRVF